MLFKFCFVDLIYTYVTHLTYMFLNRGAIISYTYKQPPVFPAFSSVH